MDIDICPAVSRAICISWLGRFIDFKAADLRFCSQNLTSTEKKCVLRFSVARLGAFSATEPFFSYF
jgi:hypothetical protein